MQYTPETTAPRRFGARAGALLALSLLAWSPAASAQIVNVQSLIVDPAREGFGGAVDASLDLRTGNTDLLLVSASLLLRYRAGRHLIFGIGRQELGMESGARFLSRDFEHLRYRLSLEDWLEAETFVQHDRDEFRRVAWRFLWGLGPRFLLVTTDTMSLAVGSAYMLEIERLDRAPLPDSGERHLAHRSSSYVAFSLRLNDRLRLGESLYVQPRLDRPLDTRVLNETELGVDLEQRLLLKLTFSLSYDAFPPAGRAGLDTATKTSVQIRFR